MAATGVKIRKARKEALAYIHAAQDQAETAFPTAQLTLTNSENIDFSDNSDDLAQLLADYRSRDLAAGRSLAGPHRDDLFGVFAAKDVPAKDSSTGEQKALLISLILGQRPCAETTNGPTADPTFG